MKIIFDYNRTLFDPETDALYAGVIELLKKLSEQNELSLISRNDPSHENRLQELGIRGYFKEIAFVEEKTTQIFKKLADGEQNIIVIGDRIKEEISLGNQLGFITIWIRQGKFSEESPANEEENPRYTVDGIEGLQNIISKYEK